MAYIVLTLTGMIAILMVKKEWSGGKQVLFILVFLLAGWLGYLAVDILGFTCQANFLKPLKNQSLIFA